MKLSTAIAIIALALCVMIFASIGRQYLTVLETAATAVPTVEEAYRERTSRIDAAIDAAVNPR